nr:uncharacterized protein LOC128684033 [Cherax quadricarinatus]
MLIDDGLRSKWPLGKIVVMNPNGSSTVRTIEILGRGSLHSQTIDRLDPLELHCSVKETMTAQETPAAELESSRPHPENSTSHTLVQNFEGGGNSGFIPITIAPSPHGVAASVGVFTSARPQPLTVSSTHSVRNPLIQPLQPQVSQVVASQVQLSVVPQNLQQAPPAIPPLPAAANAISLPQHLLSPLLSSSSPPDLSKSFSTILASSDQDNSSLVSAATVNVPELHIPEGSVNLPLLDISLGGTVTIRDQTANLLSTDPDATLGMDLASTTATSTPVKSSPVTSTMICINPLQETSSDKLLDITLGISNSNSSFSSLLAAATQPRCLDSSLLDIPSMEGDGNNERVNGADAGNMSAVGIPSFPALSTTPPSPPSSPSRLLQQSDNQWLNSEVNDFSLSSFLGHFESPVKSSNSRGPSQTAPSGSFVPSLSSVYNENSVDFTATFAEMKAQVSGVFKQ